MTIPQQIDAYISGQPAEKRSDMLRLHQLILDAMPGARLWFDDGKNEDNKTVTNPTIGYGLFTIQYANGASKDFFRIGLSANSTGFSVYILGIKDKTYLNKTFGKDLGKAKVTGYCIRFKAVKDIDTGVLESAIKYAAKAS